MTAGRARDRGPPRVEILVETTIYQCQQDVDNWYNTGGRSVYVLVINIFLDVQ